ncbi:MAG: hypothetical protein ABS44_06195 [Chryseobacterium sp. SCN 40-13]|nr:MAG: hypothetical protein ABS44_06195 [Chryseobacterium sp. SCN 40-13]
MFFSKFTSEPSWGGCIQVVFRIVSFDIKILFIDKIDRIYLFQDFKTKRIFPVFIPRSLKVFLFLPSESEPVPNVTDKFWCIMIWWA